MCVSYFGCPRCLLNKEGTIKLEVCAVRTWPVSSGSAFQHLRPWCGPQAQCGRKPEQEVQRLDGPGSQHFGNDGNEHRRIPRTQLEERCFDETPARRPPGQAAEASADVRGGNPGEDPDQHD